jgi:hypothetical protein
VQAWAIVGRVLLRLALLGLALACACRPTAGPAPAPADERAGVATGAAQPGQLDAAAQQRRLRGLALMDAGRHELARAEFAAVVAAWPDNLAARALLAAATQALLAARDEAARNFASATPIVLPPPPWQHTLRREVAVAGDPPPRLIKVVSDPHGGSDEAAWFRRHDLRLPEYEVPNPMHGLPGDLPPHIPPTHGTQLLVQAIAHPDHTILFYGPDYRGGRQIAVLDAAGERLGFLDFAAYAVAPDAVSDDPEHREQTATWAEVRDGVLYVAHAHAAPGRARALTGYITALTLATGELLWRSAPRVASAYNFVIDGGHILSGYGGPGELDHVLVLARRDGEVVARARVNGAPEYLLVRGRRLFVRTDETDHEFDLR